MKRILFLLSACMYLHVVAGQTTLRLCNSVDDFGKTATAQNTFIINDGDELSMLVNSDKTFETSRLDYKIYNVGSNGSCSYATTISQNIQTNSVWAHKKIIFHSAGFYLIKVYKRDGTYLCENMVYIDWDW